MKSSFQSSKLYQADLYEQVKSNGNHIICLGQDKTKTFVLLAAIRNHAHRLHPSFGSSNCIIVEPSEEHARERQRIIKDHTELRLVNLFDKDNTLQTIEDSEGQIIITSLQNVFDYGLNHKTVHLIILDHAHLLLLQDLKLVKDVVKQFSASQLLAFMCSLIHSDHEIKPVSTVKLINQLEAIFNAKCETSSDLKSLTRQVPVANLEIIGFKPLDMLTNIQYILADSMVKQFCDVLIDNNLDDYEPITKPGQDSAQSSNSQGLLTIDKQLVLVRSCMSDVIYALHCLGLWCARKTVQLYLTEFSRLLSIETSSSYLIGAASTILSCFYGRLDELMAHYGDKGKETLQTSSQQLKTLLDSINENKLQMSTSWPIAIVYVHRRVIAKVMALWLHKISKTCDNYSYLKPNYIVGSSREHRDRMTVDNFDLHHEAAVRDCRFGHCNVLVTSALGERCTDILKCNLLVNFDLPAQFSDFIQAKGNTRYNKYIIMFNSLLETNSNERLLSYINMERLLNDVERKVALEAKEEQLMKELEKNYPPYIPNASRSPATIRRSIGIINKYCTKLPSDSFTKLTPEWFYKQVKKDGADSYYCELRLPINSPVRQTIIGPNAETKTLAMRLAAFSACKVLHKAGELDENMMPVTKASMKTFNSVSGVKEIVRPKPNGQSVGSTKHRQYYKKRIAKVFSGPLIAEGMNCYLYKFKMTLSCPLPEEQNRRGRRIIDPSETNRNFALVCTTELPKICSFPVFTRSGEVLISLELVQSSFTLRIKQIKDLKTFHEYNFSKVLRLEKYPIVFDPENSAFTVLLAPVIDVGDTTKIDWIFVDKIVHSDGDSRQPSVKEREAFKFNEDDYIDAVVIPWYRLTDRQQSAYYVAEICTDLNPLSPFPDKHSGFNTFIDYYRSKYKIEIYNPLQPVLDVDHTSARLNLLTPRYVNRKGMTLPSSTAKTRRESRESLIQKQLLIPELCSIHPYPASFWRKAVCLPCVFYRLNSLFLAEELRRDVAKETQIGFVEPPKDFEWPPLNFGWSLKDVINNQFYESSQSNNLDSVLQKHIQDDEENMDIVNSDSDTQNYDEWKDSKAKNQPLLRELFVPSGRSVTNAENEEIISLYKLMQNHSENNMDQQDTQTNTVTELNAKLISDQKPCKLAQSTLR